MPRPRMPLFVRRAWGALERAMGGDRPQPARRGPLGQRQTRSDIWSRPRVRVRPIRDSDLRSRTYDPKRKDRR